MKSVPSLVSPVSRTSRRDSDFDKQVAYEHDKQVAYEHDKMLVPVKPRTSSGTTVPQDPAHDEEQEHYAQHLRNWSGWTPPPGLIRWAYISLLILLVVALIVAPVALAKKLKLANEDASKPLHTKPYKALEMPTNTSKLFRDPYNTTGVYKVFPGEDRMHNDIFATMEYTVEACLLACNKYNEFLGPGLKPCIAGTMNYNQEESVTGQLGANCFLKSKVGDDIDNTNPMALGFRLCPSGRCSFNSTR